MCASCFVRVTGPSLVGDVDDHDFPLFVHDHDVEMFVLVPFYVDGRINLLIPALFLLSESSIYRCSQDGGEAVKTVSSADLLL